MSQKKPTESQESQEKAPKNDGEQSTSAHQDPTRPVLPAEESELEDFVPDIDEGPRPGPVD